MQRDVTYTGLTVAGGPQSKPLGFCRNFVSFDQLLAHSAINLRQNGH